MSKIPTAAETTNLRKMTVGGRRFFKRYIHVKPDLGIRALIPQWKALFSREHLQGDLFAGITVACVAVPLSLAIALASGVDPAVGLVTAIVGSLVVPFFGGSVLTISGPAAAMAVLIAHNVELYGLGGLVVIGLVCGLLQILTGFLGMGQLAKFVPTPVIAGFTAGIGAIILVGQLPRALGLPPPDQSHVVDVFTHLFDLIQHMQPFVFVLTLSTIFLIKALGRVAPKLPAPLIGVALPTLIVYLFNLQVPLVGDIPRSLPWPTIPAFPSEGWGALLGAAFVVYFLASLETLLSSSAVDKLHRGPKHDPDQELIGQGLGNVAVALFGGIPITGVIARSALNVRSGGKTRRSSLIHAVTLLFMVFALAPVISRIPIAALAGVLLSVAIAMLNWEEFHGLWKAARMEAVIYLVTFFTIVFVDLIAGVQAGVLFALLIAVIRMGQTSTLLHAANTVSPYRLTLGGPLTFLSYSKMEKLRTSLKNVEPGRGVVIELSGLTSMDTTGAALLLDFVEFFRGQGARVILKALPPRFERTLVACDEGGQLVDTMALTETDVQTLLLRGTSQEGQESIPLILQSRLAEGVQRFRSESQTKYRPLFEKLALGQSPHTLFITCSDSRISPNLITSTEPGELFLVRNVGNVVPPFGKDATPAEGAAIEFAVGVLGVGQVVICGHSGCGAVKVSLTNEPFTELPSIALWLENIREEFKSLPADVLPDVAAKHNITHQIENLKTYPIIKQKLESGELKIFGWFYDVRYGEMQELDPEKNEFRPLGALPRPA